MGITKFRHSLSSGIFLKLIVLGIAAIFVVGIILIGVPGLRNGSRQSADYAVKVNGESIPSEYFSERLLAESKRIEMEQGSSAMASQIAGFTSELLGRTITLTALRQAAEDKGIRVGRGEINDAIDKGVDERMSAMRSQMAASIESIKKKKPSKSEVDRELEVALRRQYRDQNQNMTLDAYAENFRNSINRDELKNDLIIQKLRQTLERSARGMSEKELIDSYRQVAISRILIESRIRPKGQAKHQADEIRKQLESGADFARLARERSDDSMTKKSGGAFPTPLSRDMAQMFRLDSALVKAIFVLRPGQISDVIRTRDGYEIVKVTAEQSNLPKDFEANKKQHMNQALQSKRSRVFSEFAMNVMKSAKVEIGNLELQGYWAQQQAGMQAGDGGQEAYTKAVARAAAMFEKAIQQNPNDAPAIYSLSQAYATIGKPKNAIRLLEIKLNNPDAPSVEGPDLRMLLGDLYAASKDNKRALGQYELASQVGIAIDAIHQQLVTRFKSIGRNDLAAKEQEYVDMAKAQQGGSAVPAGSPPPSPGR